MIGQIFALQHIINTQHCYIKTNLGVYYSKKFFFLFALDNKDGND